MVQLGSVAGKLIKAWRLGFRPKIVIYVLSTGSVHCVSFGRCVVPNDHLCFVFAYCQCHRATSIPERREKVEDLASESHVCVDSTESCSCRLHVDTC